MKWYWELLGGHVHIRVFMNGAKAGELVLPIEEFKFIRARIEDSVLFIEEFDGQRMWNDPPAHVKEQNSP